MTKGVFLGDTLWQQSHAAFGYLQTQGYCSNQGSCKKFPVVIGETGSFLADDKDRQWMADFGDYVQARGGARSHNNWPMAGWLWWCYNENRCVCGEWVCAAFVCAYTRNLVAE